MNLRLITQILLDKILRIIPFKIDYSISFKDKSINDLMRNQLNISIDNEKIATNLLLQGPITDYDFLFTSIKHYTYSKLFNRIIISTWENELNSKQIIELNQLGNIDIIQNSRPKYFGISNINLQIISTYNGLNFIYNKYPICYVLKSRTDQRLLNSEVNLFLKTILDKFSITSSVLKNRLVICNYNTYKYRVYSISDMFMFGNIADLLLYWTVPLDERIINVKNIERPRTMLSWSKLNLAEVYLCTNFLKNIKYNYDWSINDYWEILNSYFIVVDSDTIGLEWRKYTFNNKKGTCNQYNIRERFYNFSDWIIFQNKNTDFDFKKIQQNLQFYENIKIQKN